MAHTIVSSAPAVNLTDQVISYLERTQEQPIAEMTFAQREAAVIAYRMMPVELEALAEELMQDELCLEADAYIAAMEHFPGLYRYAKDWDVDALFDGNNDAGYLPF